MEKKFTPKYKWAFKVTTQEEADLLKNTALELGYTWESVYENDWLENPYLINCYINTSTGPNLNNGFAKMYNIQDQQFNIFDTWSLELFKAIILASEEEEFVPGEWAKAKSDYTNQYTKDKLYQVKRYSDYIETELDDQGSTENGWHKDNFTKPTLKDLIEKFKPKEKQTRINVKGSKNLIAGFITELEGMGWKPRWEDSKEECIRKEQIATSNEKRTYSQNLYQKIDVEVEFNLPLEWDTALEAFKNYDKVEYQVGDWVYHIPGFRADSYNDIYGGAGYIEGAVTQIREVNSNCLFFRDWTNGVFLKALRPATPEEIEKATKPNDITVICKYEGGFFNVRVKAGTNTILAEDNSFQISEIRALYDVMTSTCTYTDLKGPWDINFPYVNIGCKYEVPVHSSKDIIDAWEKLNK